MYILLKGDSLGHMIIWHAILYWDPVASKKLQPSRTFPFHPHQSI